MQDKKSVVRASRLVFGAVMMAIGGDGTRSLEAQSRERNFNNQNVPHDSSTWGANLYPSQERVNITCKIREFNGN